MTVEIKFEPEGRFGLVADGTILWDAAKRLGVRLPADCQGRGECDTCAVIVESGASLLSGLTDAERLHLNSERITAGERLACQTKLERSGEVVVRPVPITVRAATPGEAAKDLKKEFGELPLKRRLVTLVELEATTMIDTLDAIIEVPINLAAKFIDFMSGRGRKLSEGKKEVGASPDLNQGEAIDTK